MLDVSKVELFFELKQHCVTGLLYIGGGKR